VFTARYGLGHIVYKSCEMRAVTYGRLTAVGVIPTLWSGNEGGTWHRHGRTVSVTQHVNRRLRAILRIGRRKLV